MGFSPSTVKMPTKEVRTGNSLICEMEASSPATTVNSVFSALRPTMTHSCKWVPIKRQPGDGEIGNITNAKKTMLKTMLPEGGEVTRLSSPPTPASGFQSGQ